MNINHLRYASEVDKTGSISRAAENLYMSQPNLSKAIKELESTLGFMIFKRTPRGITTTKKGREFLKHARNIIMQMDAMEQMYGKDSRPERQRFSIAVPESGYISYAFAEFVNTLDKNKNMNINYFETNAAFAMNNILDGNCDIGIIRCGTESVAYYEALWHEKGFRYEKMSQFEYRALISKDYSVSHPVLTPEILSEMIEIICGDFTEPVYGNSEDEDIKSRKKIYVCERASQADLLKNIRGSFTLAPPCPAGILNAYGLAQKKIEGISRMSYDFLFYPAEYKLSELDERFIAILKKIIKSLEADSA